MFYTQSLRQGILLNHSYTDEMQTLKNMMERRELEQKRRESECMSDSVCMS